MTTAVCICACVSKACLWPVVHELEIDSICVALRNIRSADTLNRGKSGSLSNWAYDVSRVSKERPTIWCRHKRFMAMEPFYAKQRKTMTQAETELLPLMNLEHFGMVFQIAT